MSEFQPFLMERMQSKFEHDVAYNLSESGVHPVTLEELLGGDRSAVRALLATELNYPHVNGIPALRENIAGTYGLSQDYLKAGLDRMQRVVAEIQSQAA